MKPTECPTVVAALTTWKEARKRHTDAQQAELAARTAAFAAGSALLAAYHALPEAVISGHKVRIPNDDRAFGVMGVRLDPIKHTITVAVSLWMDAEGRPSKRQHSNLPVDSIQHWT